MELTIARRTVSLPQSTIDRVERLRRKDESFSAAVARLLEAGAGAVDGYAMPGYVGIAGGPPLEGDVEEVLDEIFRNADPND